jgi:hypothetical protein
MHKSANAKPALLPIQKGNNGNFSYSKNVNRFV